MNEPPPDLNMNKHGINWERVAQKVGLSSASFHRFGSRVLQVSEAANSSVQRTAKECEIRWLGERHPQYNHAQWSQSEIAKVRELVDGAREGEVDWVKIAEKLGVCLSPKLTMVYCGLADAFRPDWTHTCGLHATRHSPENTYVDARGGPTAVGGC